MEIVTVPLNYYPVKSWRAVSLGQAAGGTIRPGLILSTRWLRDLSALRGLSCFYFRLSLCIRVLTEF